MELAYEDVADDAQLGGHASLVTKPFTNVGECDMHYDNASVEDIYRRWDAIVAPEDRSVLMRFVHELVILPAESFDNVKSFQIQYVIIMKKIKARPRKAALLHVYRGMLADGDLTQPHEALERCLVTKASKSQSGVLVVTVLTSPYPEVGGKRQRFSCKWNCYYCPNEPGQPRSYLRDEPAVLRANQNRFDPVCQFTDRMATLAQNGHPTDKVELLVLGGTWASYPLEYRELFCRDLFFAANTFHQRRKRPRLSLAEEQEINQTTQCKIIGLTLETRPDTIDAEEVRRLRYYGCTRVQLGLQHTDNAILDKINRDCTTEQAIQAIALLKDACFKIDIHLMPNLPGSTVALDDAMFSRMLSDSDLQADQWKIYPCEVTPWTVIERWFNEGRFVPYPDEELMEVLIRVKSKMHPWIRLNRVIRDIPSNYILGGVDAPNLREVLQHDMESRGLSCPCIRCREVGRSTFNLASGALLCEREYWGSGARELFISFESLDRSVIFAFLRLRLPVSTSNADCLHAETSVNVASKQARTAANLRAENLVFPELKGAALVRELHVYGKLIKAELGSNNAKGKANDDQSQHRGFGRRLMHRAEQWAALKGYTRVAVISGVGVRSYYANLGYNDDQGEGKFMLKDLTLLMRVRLALSLSLAKWQLTGCARGLRGVSVSDDFVLAILVALCGVVAALLVAVSEPGVGL